MGTLGGISTNNKREEREGWGGAIFSWGGGYVFVAMRRILPGPPAVSDILRFSWTKLCPELPVVHGVLHFSVKCRHILRWSLMLFLL